MGKKHCLPREEKFCSSLTTIYTPQTAPTSPVSDLSSSVKDPFFDAQRTLFLPIDRLEDRSGIPIDAVSITGIAVAVMGLSRVVASVAVFPAALGWALTPFLPLPVTLVLYHIAATGFTVALAASEPLTLHTRWILGKRKNGRLHLWGKLLFWPYHVGIRTRIMVRRWTRSEPRFHEIVPGWSSSDSEERLTDCCRFVGSWPESECALPEDKVAVMDCTCELPKMHNSEHYLCLPVWDTHGATAEQIQEGVEWALEHRRQSRPCYIHCAHGHGRSVALLVACLVKEGICETINDAELKIKSVRPKIRLNSRQRREIIVWMQTEGHQSTINPTNRLER